MNLNPSCLNYGTVHTSAQLTPWNGDEQFKEALSLISGRTLIDVPRLWTLWNAARQTEKIDLGLAGSVLEVGVYRGGSSVILAKAIGSIWKDRKSPTKFYAVDTFEGLVDIGPKDSAHKNGELKADETDVRAFIKQHAPDAIVLKGTFPQAFYGYGGELRLVHCDVDTYESTLGVIRFVRDLLLPGGMIIVDDFGFSTCAGAAKAVGEVWGDSDLICTYNLSGQAILTKIGAR